MIKDVRRELVIPTFEASPRCYALMRDVIHALSLETARRKAANEFTFAVSNAASAGAFSLTSLATKTSSDLVHIICM